MGNGTTGQSQEPRLKVGLVGTIFVLKKLVKFYNCFCFKGKVRALVAGTWTETKKMFLGGSFLKLADYDV